MDGQTILDELQNDAAKFVSLMCYRDMADIDSELLNYNGDVVVTSKNKSAGKEELWEALHRCTTEPGTDVLFVTPNPAGARGTILLLEDELDRAPFDSDVWGIERTTDTEIEFENGSRIRSEHTQNGGNRLRGHHPDLLIVDNWEEEGCEISKPVRQNILMPMLITGGTDLWINDTHVRNDSLTQHALNGESYVKMMDH
jgi:hypothetical protein